jgi:hypothetical protein
VCVRCLKHHAPPVSPGTSAHPVHHASLNRSGLAGAIH